MPSASGNLHRLRFLMIGMGKPLQSTSAYPGQSLFATNPEPQGVMVYTLFLWQYRFPFIRSAPRYSGRHLGATLYICVLGRPLERHRARF
jgi:hypothetical protein